MDVTQPVESELWFSAELRHEGGTVVSAPQPLLPVEPWIAGSYQAQELRGADRQKKTEKESAEYEQLLVQLPWLSHLDEQTGFGTADSGSKKRRLDPEPCPEDEQQLPEVDVLEALAALDKARALWVPPPTLDVEHFWQAYPRR